MNSICNYIVQDRTKLSLPQEVLLNLTIFGGIAIIASIFTVTIYELVVIFATASTTISLSILALLVIAAITGYTCAVRYDRT